MKRILIVSSLFFLLLGCKNDKYNGRYELYTRSYNSNNTAWLLFDKHDGITVEILHFENPVNADERGIINGGYYIEDTPPSHWNFPTFNTYNFKHNYSSLEGAIAAADSGWHEYKLDLTDRYAQKDKNLVRFCRNCETLQVYKKVDLP